ncbi:dual specificity calcium/calmodulin-dependent 3',5'-cyclic nucleotide phosphodiesterase 1A-like [Bolinopsis microptera]|uniref:dual specificity calcium/calmodulin-dependent 3',5'-cyclic nucleotide phosphodiesterase 1A-like n=1 Tax=Bolinopsis microptera TaxID=2820187 RepID=UPI00307ABA8E
MGSCCSNVCVFTHDAVNDLKWKYDNFSSPIRSRGCLCWKKGSKISQRTEDNSQFTQTEEVVFKLMEKPNVQLKLLSNEIDNNNKRNRNWSTEAKHSHISLVSVCQRGSSTVGNTRSIEEVLAVIERVQNLCNKASLQDQLSLLCTVGFLREYCLMLNDDTIGGRKKSDSSVTDDNARFWVTAYDYSGKNKDHGITKFKKIAMAVKTARVFTRMTRSSLLSHSSSTESIYEPVGLTNQFRQFLDKNLLSWNFDQLLFDKLTNNHGLSLLFLKILQATDLFKEFKINKEKMNKFCLAVERGYQQHNNPYHNERHGADVLQTAYFIIVDTKIKDWLSSLELLSLLFAAMIHDLEHTGTNNIFHTQSSSSLSLLYNDKSVLENHHVSRAYILMSDPELNPFEAMSKAQFQSMRQIVVDCVLATDMAHHFNQVTTLKNSLIDLSLIERQDVMNSILHCADISGPGKCWNIHENWTLLLMQEFFAQGDEEKKLGLPISPLCDRQTTNIPESQVGFITYITTPAFTALGNTIDAILREKEEREFLEFSTSWVNTKQRRGSTVTQMTPIEENPYHQLVSQSPLSLAPERVGSAGITQSFQYMPINRVWDTHFQSNLARWKDRLTNSS